MVSVGTNFTLSVDTCMVHIYLGFFFFFFFFVALVHFWKAMTNYDL